MFEKGDILKCSSTNTCFEIESEHFAKCCNEYADLFELICKATDRQDKPKEPPIEEMVAKRVKSFFEGTEVKIIDIEVLPKTIITQWSGTGLSTKRKIYDLNMKFEHS